MFCFQFRHKVLISDRKKVKTVKQLSQQAMASEVEEVKGTKFVAQLRKFGNIGGYSGVSVRVIGGVSASVWSASVV